MGPIGTPFRLGWIKLTSRVSRGGKKKLSKVGLPSKPGWVIICWKYLNNSFLRAGHPKGFESQGGRTTGCSWKRLRLPFGKEEQVH